VNGRSLLVYRKRGGNFTVLPRRVTRVCFGDCGGVQVGGGDPREAPDLGGGLRGGGLLFCVDVTFSCPYATFKRSTDTVS
jgi:hypothetical protein